MTYGDAQTQFAKEFKKFEEIYSKCNNMRELGAEYNRLMFENRSTIANTACCYAFENRVQELKGTTV